MSEKLQPHFSLSFEGDIWQQSLSGRHLLLTIRDQEQMQVTFSLLDLTNGSFVFDGLAFEEGWWISVYHFFEETIVFQVHENSQDMDEKTYFSMNIHDCEVIWSMDKVLTTGRDDHLLQLRSLEAGDVLFYLDIRTGETFTARPEKNSKKTISDKVLQPLHYVEESEHFDTIKAFGERKLGKALHGACDYLEYKGLVFLAYHFKEEDGLTNELVVIDPKTGPLLNKILCSGLSGLSSGTFFIAHEQLIFVEGKNRLNSFRI